MKNCNYLIAIALVCFAFISGCQEEERKNHDLSPGNPTVEAKTQFTGAYFGDDLPFTVTLNDNVPLSTLTVSLFFGEERVSQREFRVTQNGDFSGSINVPFFQNVADGTATLEFTLLDTHMTSVTRTYNVPVSRANYPYLILVTANATFPMYPTDNPHEYAVTDVFGNTEVPAYIRTPVMNENGNVITFGSEGGVITHGVTGEIPFETMESGGFTISFNTRTYEAGPFPPIFVNGERMSKISPNNFAVVANFTQGQEIAFEGDGFADIDEWWIDPDFFEPGEEDNVFKLLPIAGRYRIIANFTLKYFDVQVMSGNSMATLQANGTGAVWVKGNGVGKPSLANSPAWDQYRGLCMAPMGDGKYQLTLVVGETGRFIPTNNNQDNHRFKFFHQNDWGGEYRTDGTNSMITTTSNLVSITAGGDVGPAFNDITFTPGEVYVFVLDVGSDRSSAVLTVTKK